MAQVLQVSSFLYIIGIASSCVNELDEILGYVAISYPFGPYFFLYFGNSSLLSSSKSNKPKLFIIGDKDNFTSTSKFWDRMENFRGNYFERKVK